MHAEQGQGNIGPNLTDDHWLHGKGTLMDIYGTVHDGVPQKGMPAWSRQLTPAELTKVVAFVGTLRGKDLPGKAPEGAEVDMASILESETEAKGESAATEGAGGPAEAAKGTKGDPSPEAPEGEAVRGAEAPSEPKEGG